MQAPLEDILRYCVTELPGAPDAMIINALNDSAIDLCRQSGCWNTWVDISLAAGQSEYAITPPATNSRLWLVRTALFNGHEFKPMPADQQAAITPAMFSQQGTPTCYWFSSVNTMQVLPIPVEADAGRVIKLRAVWTPTVKATEFDEDLMERYQEALTSGAKAKLMRMPGQTWSNPDLSMYYEATHRQLVGGARIDQMSDMTVGSMSVKPRTFGRRN